ncbi:hypothetical protein M0R45_012997 [Rubus argutus]|uniref:Protein kinase domain-containing protein n=1 Tax=Rubus argutus TaxID=59490 RepID=A0AAW1XGV5_RUBAR
MARIFCENQNTANTKRVVGTHGYMAPEYAMEGLFSVKSDVFSFGVVLLEIISGKRNSGFYLTEHAKTLVEYAWTLWKDGKGSSLWNLGRVGPINKSNPSSNQLTLSIISPR